MLNKAPQLPPMCIHPQQAAYVCLCSQHTTRQPRACARAHTQWDQEVEMEPAALVRMSETMPDFRFAKVGPSRSFV